MKSIFLTASAVIAVAATAASAQTTTVTTLDGSQGMAAPASEQYANSSVTITSNTALSSDGSLAFTGGRGRVLNGNNYAPNQNFGAANGLVSLTGDYLVYDGGAAGVQSPAFRVYIQDGTQRSELIWEAAYNGGYTLGTADSVLATDSFYQNVAGVGTTNTTPTSGTYVFRTLQQWGDLYSTAAFVSAFGVGFGGDAGASFSALADNVVLTTDTGSRGYNFVATASAAVPEPATWAMMIAGFGMVGGAMRRRKVAVRFA